MEQLALVYMTAGSLEEARALAKGLIEEGLAACVNYWQNIASVYRWQGQLCEEQEVVLLVKTTAAQFTQIKAFVETHHSYSIPCLMQLAVADVNAVYAQWVRGEVAANSR